MESIENKIIALLCKELNFRLETINNNMVYTSEGKYL